MHRVARCDSAGAIVRERKRILLFWRNSEICASAGMRREVAVRSKVAHSVRPSIAPSTNSFTVFSRG